MRCFIAINLPEEVKRKVVEITNKIQDNGIKIVSKENLHLTLKFLGEVDENMVREVINSLGNIKFEKFRVEIVGIGFFPSKSFVRVVWFGVEEGKENIISLQKEIDENLFKLNFKKEKNFEPHLTIARIKFLRDKNKFFRQLEKIQFKASFEAESFELMQSILQREGPIYKIIKSFNLV